VSVWLDIYDFTRWVGSPHQNNGLSITLTHLVALKDHCLRNFSSKFTFHPKKKIQINKNQRWEHIHRKYKAYENTSRHNPNKKQKQTINKNQVKTLCKEDTKQTINKNQVKTLCKEDTKQTINKNQVKTLCKEDPKQTITKNQVKILCKEDPKQTINKNQVKTFYAKRIQSKQSTRIR